MKNQRRLTHQQQQFLRNLRDEPCTLEELVGRYKLRSWVLSKWFRRRAFREALAEILKEMRRQSALEFDLGVRNAKHVMSNIITGKLKAGHLVMHAAAELIDLDFRKPRRNRIKLGGGAVDVPAPQAHPSHSPAYAKELLERLEAPDPAEPSAPGPDGM